MTRKESEKDSERPHYYSQFWLDVAAGRRVIGTPKPSEELDAAEIEVSDVTPSRRAGRASIQEDEDELYPSSRRSGEIVHPVADVGAADDEFPELEEDFASDEEGQGMQDTIVEDADIPDMDLSPIEEEEEEDLYDEEEEGEEGEEEEEEDIGWGGRGRKKSKPSRQAKAPKKPVRRERRPGF